MMAQVCAWACCSAGGAPSTGIGERRSPSVVGLGWSLKAGFLVIGRVGRRVGGRRKPVLGGLAAACSCALSCAHGKTGVGHRAQPARGMPRAHAGDTPAPPTHPALDRSLRLTHHGKSQARAKAGRFAHKAEAASHPPLLLLLPLPFFLIFPWCVPEAGNCPRSGGEAGQGREPHGCGDRAYMDVLAAPPALPPHPAKPMNPGFQRPTHPHHGGAPPFADLRRRRAFHGRNNF